MDYSYNYGFLKKYMERWNLHKKDILSALGTQDYTTLTRWINGEQPLHINGILRFCNYFNVPLCNFFFDDDGLPCDFSPCMPGPDDITSPTKVREREKGILDIHVTSRNPETAEQRAAVEYGLMTRDAQIKKRDAATRKTRPYENEDLSKSSRVEEPFVMKITAADDTTDQILHLKMTFLEEMRENEQKQRQKIEELYDRFDSERSRLLAIIEGLQKEVERLSAN